MVRAVTTVAEDPRFKNQVCVRDFSITLSVYPAVNGYPFLLSSELGKMKTVRLECYWYKLTL